MDMRKGRYKIQKLNTITVFLLIMVLVLAVGLSHPSTNKLFVQGQPTNLTDSNGLRAYNQSVVTREDASIDIILNGSDVEANKSLTFYPVSNTSKGNLTAIMKIGNDTEFNNGTRATAKTTYTPLLNLYGNDSFTFTVSNGLTNSSIGNVSIKVDPVNDPPMPNAGVDLVIDEGSAVLLNGNSSRDPENDTIQSYIWVQVEGPPVTLKDHATARPVFSAPNVTADSPLAFSLRAIDENNAVTTNPDIVNVTIKNLPISEPQPFMPSVDTVYIYLLVLLIALLFPLVYDVVQGYRHIEGPGKPPVHTEGLNRTLLAYGIIIIIAILSFHVILTVTNNMQNPDPNVQEVNRSFVEITENMTTLFGGAVSAIIGFYFGQRALESRRNGGQAT